MSLPTKKYNPGSWFLLLLGVYLLAVGLTNAAIGGPTPIAQSDMKREYVWGPGDRGWGGGVDELLVQYDAGRQPWWVLADAGGDVVGVAKRHGTGASAHARVAAQWTYDAYGAVVAAEVFDATSPVNRCGHKGLFADRLDVGVLDGPGGEEHERLAQGADLLYHNRNRTLSPRLGRFLQSDPNELGTPYMTALSFNGGEPSAQVLTFSMTSHYGDGFNHYAYLKSNPWHMNDPLGLEADDDTYGDDDLVEDFFKLLSLLNPIPGPGDYIQGALKGLVENYSARLEADVDWAMDWSQGDDLHSRGSDEWIPFAMLSGVMEEFNIEIPFTGETVSPLAPALANAGGGSTAAASAPEHHIMTNKNFKAHLAWSQKFQDLFDDAGITKAEFGDPFEWKENKVGVPGHKGPHTDKYHQKIFDRAKRAIGTKEGKAAADALRARLDKINKTFQKKGIKYLGLDEMPDRRKKK